MSADPRRVIVIESCCPACDVDTVLVYHQNFPEMTTEGISAAQAADQLVDQLTVSLDSVCDPLHREVVQIAILDAQAFVDREG